MIQNELLKNSQSLNINRYSEDLRINFDTNLRRWFSRNIGVWRSRRQYFFEQEDVLHLEMFISIEELKSNNEDGICYKFSWWCENIVRNKKK